MISRSKTAPVKIFTTLLWVIMLMGSLFLISSCKSKDKEPAEQTQEIPAAQEKLEEFKEELDEKNKIIEELKEEYNELENQIPKSQKVEKGDSHWQISYDFLTQDKGLSPEEARRNLSDALLFNPIREGFKIWNYFYNENFGSFITQGLSDVSPGSLMRAKNQDNLEEKNKLKNKIQNLKNLNQELTNKVDQIQNQYSVEKEKFRGQIKEIKSNLEKAQSHNQKLESSLNSVYYFADTRESLKEKKIIKGSFLGICGTSINQTSPADYTNQMDLRKNDHIELKAEELGVSQIKKAALLPKHFRQDIDYQIEYSENRNKIELTFLNKEKFRLAHLIILLN